MKIEAHQSASRFGTLGLTRRALVAAALFLAPLALTGIGASIALAAPEATIEIKHAQGTTKVPVKPKTVAVFDMTMLDNMHSLGIKANGVPSGPRPDYLNFYADEKTPVIGTLFEPDFESLAALAPDLIIVGGRSAAKYKDLSKIAPTIDMTVDLNDYFESALRQATTLGQIFGIEDVAAQRIQTVRDHLKVLHEKANASGTALMVLTVGNKMSAYGPGSRFGILHTVFGLKAAAPDLTVSTHGQSISPEFIVKTDPDWLFVIDRDTAIGTGKSSDNLLKNELLARTKAVSNNRVVLLDPVAWYLVGGGLSAITTMIEQIGGALERG